MLTHARREAVPPKPDAGAPSADGPGDESPARTLAKQLSDLLAAADDATLAKVQTQISDLMSALGPNPRTDPVKSQLFFNAVMNGIRYRRSAAPELRRAGVPGFTSSRRADSTSRDHEEIDRRMGIATESLKAVSRDPVTGRLQLSNIAPTEPRGSR